MIEPDWNLVAALIVVVFVVWFIRFWTQPQGIGEKKKGLK